MRCPTCSQNIKARDAWKGVGGQFYCSEFCADSEADSEIVIPFRTQVIKKHEIDRQYRERLERLLPLRRAMQAQAS